MSRNQTDHVTLQCKASYTHMACSLSWWHYFDHYHTDFIILSVMYSFNPGAWQVRAWRSIILILKNMVLFLHITTRKTRVHSNDTVQFSNLIPPSCEHYCDNPLSGPTEKLLWGKVVPFCTLNVYYVKVFTIMKCYKYFIWCFLENGVL